jgi:putative DNA primase/helicase
VNIVEQFAAAMRTSGVEPPGEITADGKLHRFTCPGDRARSNNGFYVLYPDEPAAGQFGSWKLGITENWCSKEYRSLSPAEKSRNAANMEAARKEREAERAKIQTECRKWCADTWKSAKDATNDHEYLKRKGVKAYGLKMLKNALMVPVKDMAGALHGLQFIQTDGAKRFKTGTDKAGHFHTIGRAKDNTIIVTEGYATAGSVYAATGHCTLVAFDAGNLKAVAEVVRAKRPGYKIIIASDDDAATTDNPGLSKATAAALAVGGWLAAPAFLDHTDKSDFNDMHAEQGLEAVRRQIEAATKPAAPAAAPVTSVSSGGYPVTESKEEPASSDPPGRAWPEPLLFGGIDTPEIPADLLPGWLGEYSKAVARTTQTPAGLSVMFALATVATCIQKLFEVSPYGDDYKEPLSLWTLTALDPGNRKSAVKACFTEPLIEWENEEHTRQKPLIKQIKHQRDINQKTIEQLKARASKPDTTTGGRKELLQEIDRIEKDTPEELIPPRVFSDDCTPERLQTLLVDHGGRMALLSDEGGVIEVMAGLYSGGRLNMNVFLQGHAGTAIRVDRQGRTVIVNRPALTFGLMVQPDVIAELTTGNKARFRGNGTLARFLYCLPRSTVGTRDVTQRIPIPESVKKVYRDGIMGLLNIGPSVDERERDRPRILTLDPDALLAWQQFSQYVEDRQGQDGEFSSVQDWTSKLPGAALRIAGLFHVVEHGEAVDAIGVSTMEMSLDLCDLLIAHARAAFDGMGSEQAYKDAQTVFRWIVATGRTSFRQNEALKGIRQFRTVERLEQALKVLTSRNIVSEPYKRNSGGRPAILYAVNPAVLPAVKPQGP